MRINDPRIIPIFKNEDANLQIMSSIVGKYIYFEVPYEGELVCEQLENEKGEVMYFKTEDDAQSIILKIKGTSSKDGESK